MILRIYKAVRGVKKIGLTATAIGFFTNFLLFLVKLYIGISSASLTIYCDAVNNLGDTFACAIAVIGFIMITKMGERQSLRTQSLLTLLISLFIAAVGLYFVYGGLRRLLYPVVVLSSTRFIIILCVTALVKVLLGIMFRAFNKKSPSSVLSALALDSFLDCLVTAASLMSLVLSSRIRYSIDGAFAIITGSIITASAIKNIINESKYLVND